ncbi:MAG: phosphatidylglycerophosphatase A, partial [Candidatus Riflebacteria bacterium]|nr:phosphatidylglycerophosphatase A [Candidatus Riflebacteria bacterium]
KNRPEAKRLIRLLGSCCYLGYIKKYPGTFGSLPGIVFFLITKDLNLWLQGLLLVAFIILAIVVSQAMEDIDEVKDPVEIVIDETAGMWVALFGLWEANLAVIVTAFLLFRILDFFKPFPISIFQTFNGGKGIVADDVAVGMVTNLVVRILLLKNIL